VAGALAAYFGAAEDAGGRCADTRGHVPARQDGLDGERLRAADHTALWTLWRVFQEGASRCNIVDESATWTERMRAVANRR